MILSEKTERSGSRGVTDPKKEFAHSLLALLEKRGMKQIDLSRLSGIPQSAISAYCSGKNDPSLSKAVAIADVLGVSLDELAGRQLPRRENESRLLGHFRELNEEGQEVLVNLAFGMKSTYKKRFESGMAAAKGRVG